MGFRAPSISPMLADWIADHDGYLRRNPGKKAATAVAVVRCRSISAIKSRYGLRRPVRHGKLRPCSSNHSRTRFRNQPVSSAEGCGRTAALELASGLFGGLLRILDQPT